MPDDPRQPAMQALYDEGYTFEQIGEQYGVSRQRIGQIIGPQRENAHNGGRRKAALLKVRKAAFDRIMAEKSTLKKEAEKFGVTEKHLRHYLDENGMHVPSQFDRAPKHGTVYRYQQGCKCNLCRQASRDQRARMRSKAEPPTHGLSGYTNYGCMCDVCRAAGSQNNRDQAEKRRRREEKS